ncbi:hypothetical protein ACIQWA_38525 [Kitasatospora sp. NPDC098652]|uniref:hypothetical protein n=1 Tax=Kitasatospora sp. NPDC098652 TaxID=3364095 RepID=UPI0037FF072C
MIVMQPVLEARPLDDFDLWPVADTGSTEFLALDGGLSPAEVGTAVLLVARCNGSGPDLDPEGERPPRPADPLGSFLYGLLTVEDVYAAGGLRVTDRATGIVFQPGCCDGLEDWRDWHGLAEHGGLVGYGHEPVSPVAERFGSTVRLTVNADEPDSPVIVLPVVDLGGLLAGVERDLADFLGLAADWARQYLPPVHRAPVTAALARALDLPVTSVPTVPGSPPEG